MDVGCQAVDYANVVCFELVGLVMIHMLRRIGRVK